MTDEGRQAVGAGCTQLKTLNLGGCNLVTDAVARQLRDRGCRVLGYMYQ
jgi:hypothetical protein